MLANISQTRFEGFYQIIATYYRDTTDLSTRGNYNVDFKMSNVACIPCNSIIRNHKPNSTPDDVIVTYSIGKIKNIGPFIRSLRSTGCKASVILLLDSDAYNSLDAYKKSFIEGCGVTIINCGKCIYRQKLDFNSYGYIWCVEFVEQNKHLIDRVIYADLFDIYFQGDPFYEGLKRDEIQIADEELELKFNPAQQDWMKNCSRSVNEKDKDWKYPCSGYFAGGADIFLRFMKLYLSEYKFGSNCMDQGLIASMIADGDFSRHEIPINMKFPYYIRNLYFTHTWNGETLGTMRIAYDRNQYALIIHHTHYNYGTKIAIYKFCPPHALEFELDYISKCDPKCVEELRSKVSDYWNDIS